MVGSVTKSSGVRVVAGWKLAYDLYVPEGAKEPLPGVLMLHGFGADKKSLSGHALRVAASGVAAVLTPNMSSLMAGGLAAAQARNIAQAVDWAAWLAQQPPTKGGPGVALVGHSAGGAVAFEAAVALAAAGAAPRAVCLLDAVPWPRTLAAAHTFPAAEVPLFAMRCPDSAWNAHGAMRAALQAVPHPGACVAYLPRSRHGDAVDPKKSVWAMRIAGLLGSPDSGVILAQLLDNFLVGALGPDTSTFEAQLEALAKPHKRDLVVERRWGQEADAEETPEPASEAEPAAAAGKAKAK
jgi:pimeloyl-ACP methyl ester carboxylesterase